MSYLSRILSPSKSCTLFDKVLCNIYYSCTYSRNFSVCKPLIYPKIVLNSSGLYIRNFSDKKESAVSTAKPRTDVSTDVKVTVKEAAKTVSYTGVILVGIGVTAVMLYAIVSELFSSKSPNSVYTKAVERCCADERVKNALGEPIQAYGEESRRGRRRHTSHILYEKDGVEHMRMVFYLKGCRERATAHLEMKENESGKYEYRYLFVQLDLSKRVIVLEDNRASSVTSLPPNPSDLYKYDSPLSS